MKRVNLALQGGGAHGAFTWGVLDRLLEEPDLEIAAISGTSAGALNGAAVKAGLAQNDRKLAQDNLAWLWEQMGAVTDPVFESWMSLASPAPGLIAKWIEYSPFFSVADTSSRMFSPYTYGPLYENPLRRVVERFHYDKVCASDGPDFFVSATNVRTGKIRVFAKEEVTPDVLLASACLPTLFQAPEFKDPKTGTTEAFWDGGYTGNPALFPMYKPQLPNDIIVVNINPLERDDIPKTPQDIQNRINEISFNSSLLRELRAIQFVRDLVADGRVVKGTMKDVLVHIIADDPLMRELSVATKMVPTPQVISALKSAGERAASTFLDTHWDRLGVESSVNLEDMFG